MLLNKNRGLMSCLICVCQVSTVWDLPGFALILLIQCRWSKPVFSCRRGEAAVWDFHHSMEGFLNAKGQRVQSTLCY